LIDAGGRFAFGAVPEYIIFDKPNMAKEFIETIETGMKLSKSIKTSFYGGKNLETTAELFKQEQELKATINEPVTEEVEIEEDSLLDDEPQEEVIDVEHNKQLKQKVASKYKTATAEQKAQVKEILGNYNATKLDETKPTQMFEDILAIL
jgi:hypothetical protein